MEGVIRVAENKDRRKHQNEENTVGSGMGVVPEDTIAQALDPFGNAAATVSREDMGNKVEKDNNKPRKNYKL